MSAIFPGLLQMIQYVRQRRIAIHSLGLASAMMLAQMMRAATASYSLGSYIQEDPLLLNFRPPRGPNLVLLPPPAFGPESNIGPRSKSPTWHRLNCVRGAEQLIRFLCVFDLHLDELSIDLASCCNNSNEMLSGDLTKAMWPSRGGRLIVTPPSINR